MSTQSKTSLDKLTKTALVDVVLDQQEKIESLSSEPMTSTKLVKTKLALVSNGQTTEVEIEKIRADRDIQIEKIKKEADLKIHTSLTDVIEDYDKIKSDMLDVDNALKSEIASAEVETSEIIADYTSKAVEAKTKAEEVISEQLAAIDKSTEAYKLAVADLRKENERTVNDIDFDHKLALKQKNDKFAETLAKSLGLSLVETSELKELRDAGPLSEDKVNERISIAVATAVSKSEAKNGAILRNTKHDAELSEIRLATTLSSLETQLKTANERVASLDSQVKEFPTTLNQALVAAKSDVKVTNEGTKK